MTSGADSGPNFLLDWHESADSNRFWRAAIGTLIVHAVIVTLVVFLASLSGPAMQNGTEIVPDFRQAVHLILPQDLTQKAPNKGKVAKEVNVEDLKPRPASQERLPPAPAVRAFRPPNPRPPGPEQATVTPRIADPPKIETPVTTQNTAPAPPALSGTPKAPPPPQIQPVEQPKLAFETPGQNGPSDYKGQGKLSPPKASVQDAVRDIARGGGGQGRVVVGDVDQPPDLPPSARAPGQLPQLGSSLELKSDTMGADFKPYLIQVLTLVKKNWYAVVPESAHLGNHGLVQIQFIIDRSGTVPKLVIATPSGSESLDKAAVAGIGASQPFPPFPKDFSGQQLRLELSFKY
ncbi:MAG TPA: TonB family protein [Bryobacteraceae bacterium]|nr:TonB family protein [Bryobacteraceae bacterium]